MTNITPKLRTILDLLDDADTNTLCGLLAYTAHEICFRTQQDTIGMEQKDSPEALGALLVVTGTSMAAIETRLKTIAPLRVSEAKLARDVAKPS